MNSPIKQSITDPELMAVCKAFGLTPHEGWLDV